MPISIDCMKLVGMISSSGNVIKWYFATLPQMYQSRFSEKRGSYIVFTIHLECVFCTCVSRQQTMYVSIYRYVVNCKSVVCIATTRYYISHDFEFHAVFATNVNCENALFEFDSGQDIANKFIRSRIINKFLLKNLSVLL